MKIEVDTTNNWMADEPEAITWMPLEALFDHNLRRKYLMAAERRREDERVFALFRDRTHARQVWDDWDAIDPIGEDAHRYLNMIGDGHYCAV